MDLERADLGGGEDVDGTLWYLVNRNNHWSGPVESGKGGRCECCGR